MASARKERKKHVVNILSLRLFPLAILGVLMGSLALPSLQTSAHIDFEGHTRYYSYTNSSCNNAIDPVSVVFYYAATIQNVDTHARHHGGWTTTGGGTQYFYDHFCGAMDHDNASGCGQCNRHHMREWWNYDSPPPGLSYYTLATPHKEDFVWTCFPPSHAVESSGAGGFVAAKWDIAANWHNWNNGGGTHWFGGTSYYAGNTWMFWQCDGEWAGNDGWIDFVEILW
jgi:hypothetical protein